MQDRVLADIIGLMFASPVHRKWSIEEIDQFIVPSLDRCALIWSENRVVAYAAYAVLTLEAEDGFVSGSRKLQTRDLAAGDRLWLFDVIAPWGHASRVCWHLRKVLWQRGWGGEPIRFRRNYNDGGPRRYSQVIV